MQAKTLAVTSGALHPIDIGVILLGQKEREGLLEITHSPLTLLEFLGHFAIFRGLNQLTEGGPQSFKR